MDPKFMPKIKKSTTVSAQLMRRVFALYCVVALLVTSVHVYEEYHYTQTAIVEELKSTKTIFSEILAKALWDLDRDQLRDALESVVELPVVVGVSVYDVNGSLVDSLILDGFAAGGQDSVGSMQYEFDLQYRYGDSDIPIGLVQVFSDSSITLDRVELGFTFLLVNALIKGVALWMIFLWFGRRLLERPLSQLAKQVEEIDFENMKPLNLTASSVNPNEIDVLRQSFSIMADNLLASKKNISEIHRCLEDKVKERSKVLAEAQRQLIEAENMASIGQLVAGISHEINTPLGNSITALSYSKDELGQIRQKFADKQMGVADFEHYIEATEEAIGIMELSLRKASDLVQTFKRVAVDQSVEVLTEFSLQSHVEEVLLTLRPQLKKTNVKVVLDVEDGLYVNSYPGVYYHIISNIISNCLNHAFPDGVGVLTITMESCQQGDALRMLFVDDGVGMDAAIQSKIFDPFFTTKRGSGGTGLGLYMIFNMVTQQLGGRLEVESRVGEGTKMMVAVPKQPPDSTVSSPFSI